MLGGQLDHHGFALQWGSLILYGLAVIGNQSD
jgi:hypothetical protein